MIRTEISPGHSQVTEIVLRLFQDHGLECSLHNDWVLPNSTLPALRALWYPANSSGELQIQALVSEG